MDGHYYFCVRIGNLWMDGLEASEFLEGIGVSVALSHNKEIVSVFPKIEEGTKINEMLYYQWEKWEKPNYMERLKESYYIFQEFFTTY